MVPALASGVISTCGDCHPERYSAKDLASFQMRPDASEYLL